MFSTLQPVWLVRAISHDMTMLLTFVAAWFVFADRGDAAEARDMGGGSGKVVDGLLYGGAKGRGAMEGIGCGVQS